MTRVQPAISIRFNVRKVKELIKQYGYEETIVRVKEMFDDMFVVSEVAENRNKIVQFDESDIFF